MHLILGNGERPPFDPSDFDAYAARVRAAFLARQAELEAGADARLPVPGRRVRLLPLVAASAPTSAATRTTSRWSRTSSAARACELEAEGVHDIPTLAGLDGTRDPEAVRATRSRTSASQADLQLRSRGLDAPALRAARARARPRARPPARPVAGRRATSTSRATRTGATRASSTCSAPSTTTDGELALPAAVGASRAPRRRPRFEDVDRLDHRAARGAPRPARLPLQRLRADRAQAARRPPRDARARARRAAAPQGVRRPVRHHPPGGACRRRELRAEGASRPSTGFERNAELRERDRLASRRWQAYLETGDRKRLRRDRQYNRDDCLSHAGAARVAAGRGAPRPRPSSASSSTSSQPEPPHERRATRAASRCRSEPRRSARTLLGRPARRRIARRRPSSGRDG